jgi:hypothetical protein
MDSAIRDERRCAMDGISWSGLDEERSSDVLFSAIEPRIPELTRRAGIQLN